MRSGTMLSFLAATLRKWPLHFNFLKICIGIMFKEKSFMSTTTMIDRNNCHDGTWRYCSELTDHKV